MRLKRVVDIRREIEKEYMRKKWGGEKKDDKYEKSLKELLFASCIF